MKVFLSWSGARSRKVAESLRDWLPDVLQVAEPWMSTSDIATGKDFAQVLRQELAESNFGVLCLTKENCHRPWVLFEAGALGKVLDSSHVCPYLIDLEPTEVPYPLRLLQTAIADKDGTYKLLRTINGASQTLTLSESHLQKSFARWWPELEPRLESRVRTLPAPVEVNEFLLVNVKSGTFLEATGGDSGKAEPVEVLPYTGDDPQVWSLHQTQRGYVVIRSGHTDQCLDVEGSVKSEGAKVHQWEFHGGDNQKWALIPQKDGSYRLRCKHSALYLSYNEDYVSQRGEIDSRSQRWWLVPVIRRS
jgi:hypothetical protein